MSRRRKSKTKKSPELDPAAVLDGSVEVRFEELFDLIHRVNPTLRAMPGKEKKQRYALKNRLQSLLIRRFGDDHLKVVPAAHQGVVSLEHLSGVRDACHAVIAELDPDARSWVQRRLDAAAAGEEAEELPGLAAIEPEEVGDEIDDLLMRGRRLLEEYDYEAGEETLRQAFTASHGAAESRHAAAAQALLELLVGLLGLDSAALELEPQLSEAARKQPAIRTLLALAAARQGDVEHALELIAGLTSAVAGVSLPRVAEVHAALAAAAIKGRARRAARRHLERVAEFDPAHAGIQRLEREIAGLEAEDRRAAEADLERSYAELGAAAVEPQARALADRWPEGEVARRILRQAAAERRQQETAEHLQLGDAARAEENLDDAIEHFRAALEAGSERPGLATLVEELEEQARQRRERSAVDGVVRRLTESPAGEVTETIQTEALLAYLALAAELKAQVRERVPAPALEWLDEIDPPESGARARASATAVVALEQARLALEGGRPQDALDLLQPHRALLRPLAPARGLWQEARGQALEQRRRHELRKLDAARGLLEEGRVDAAHRQVAAVIRGDLADTDRQLFQELCDRVDAAGELARLEREHGELLAAGDLAGALVRARRLADGTRKHRPVDHPTWRRHLERHQAGLRAKWRLEEVTGEKPASQAVMPARFLESSLVWLDDDGRELVIANALDRWLFIDAVDVARGRLTARVSMRIPAPLEHPMITLRDGDRLWIAGRDGDVFEIDRQTWDLLGYYPAGELVSGERTVERARPLLGSGRLWLRATGSWGEEVCLVDLERWRLERRFPFGSSRWIPLDAIGRPRILLSTPLAARLYDGAGEQIGPDPLLRENVVDGDFEAGGRALLLLVSERYLPGEDNFSAAGADDEQGPTLVRLADPEAAAEAQTLTRLELPQAHPRYGFHTVVTSPDAGESYVLIYTRDRDQELLTFSPGESLEPASSTRLSGRATLVRDRHARHVAAVILDGADGPELRFLGPSPAAGSPSTASLDPPPEPRPASAREMPTYTLFFRCGTPTGDFGASLDALAAELEGNGIGPLRTELARLEACGDASISDKLRFALAIQRQHQSEYKLKDALEGFAHRVARKYPRDAGAVLIAADLEGRAENWDEASRLMRRAQPVSDLDDGRARHFHHVEGLAHLHGGRLDKAHQAFRRGLAREGNCKLESLVHLTAPMADPPKAAEWAPGQPPIRRLLGAIRTADHALAAGEVATARAALDRRDLRFHYEIQSAGRRASLYLQLAAATATAADRFDQRFALAFYAHLRQREQYLRHTIFLPGLSWSEERLAELEEEVVVRLDVLGGD